MRINGTIQGACIETVTTDPAASTQGRIFTNSTDGKTKIDSGTAKRAILQNDENAVLGNDATAANNVRLHKGAAGVLQTVPGSDTTLDGTGATSLAQLSSRDENLAAASLPAPGNAGRSSWVTDQKVQAVDDGAALRRIIPEFSNDDATAGSTITLAAVTASVVRLTGSFATLSMIPAGFNSQRVTLINRSGADTTISNEAGATAANRILTGTGSNLVFKNNASIPLQYDATTQRWQVVGASSSGGSGVGNSSVQVITAATYTALITDDVILYDTSLTAGALTLPSAVGNTGKRYLVEKIGNMQNNKLVFVSAINGFTGSELWSLSAPVQIISDGTNWTCVDAARGSLLFDSRPDILRIACVATTNIFLENFSVAASTVIDNISPKAGNTILLTGQTAPEENGLYTHLASNITLATTSTGNVVIATLANGTVVNSHVCATGEKVALRTQTTASENGIYVIGATAGTTVRDTSQRATGYTTPTGLKDLLCFADFYNCNNFSGGTFSSCPTETVASHVNDRLFWKQKNYNLTTFTAAVYSIAQDVYIIAPPPNAKGAHIEVCGWGGAGAGALTTRGGASGGGVMPFRYTVPLNTLSPTTLTSLRITTALGPIPGTGLTGTAGTATAIAVEIVDSLSNTYQNSYTFSGGAGALSTGVGPTAPTSVGGQLFTAGSANNVAGPNCFFSSGGGVLAGGALAGGGGGGGGPGKDFSIASALVSSNGGLGGTGTAVAATLGVNGNGTPTLGQAFPGYGCGGGGGGAAASTTTARPGGGGFGGSYYVKVVWY